MVAAAAVAAVDAGGDVLVASHTGAGKTAVAEWAIARALAAGGTVGGADEGGGGRALYTTPVKALSNQKAVELGHRFGQFRVGLSTGDIKVNERAPVVVLTTEILRNALGRGGGSWGSSSRNRRGHRRRSRMFGKDGRAAVDEDDLMAGVRVVVLDEVHMIDDPERGVVWESVILSLPPAVQLVMLSASVGNAVELAAWVGTARRRALNGVFADGGGGGVGGGGSGPAIASTASGLPVVAAATATAVGGDTLPSTTPPSTTTVFPLPRSLPVTVVTTPARVVPLTVTALVPHGSTLHARVSETTVIPAGGGALDRAAYARAVAPASARRALLAGRGVTAVTSALRRGVGTHHGGLLPILKELVESTFMAGITPILFATDTFAVGVHAPARTVVFSTLFKHMGGAAVPLSRREVDQMAGRAGRRGYDTAGYVSVLVGRGRRRGRPRSAATSAASDASSVGNDKSNNRYSGSANDNSNGGGNVGDGGDEVETRTAAAAVVVAPTLDHLLGSTFASFRHTLLRDRAVALLASVSSGSRGGGLPPALAAGVAALAASWLPPPTAALVSVARRQLAVLEDLGYVFLDPLPSLPDSSIDSNGNSSSGRPSRYPPRLTLVGRSALAVTTAHPLVVTEAVLRTAGAALAALSPPVAAAILSALTTRWRGGPSEARSSGGLAAAGTPARIAQRAVITAVLRVHTTEVAAGVCTESPDECLVRTLNWGLTPAVAVFLGGGAAATAVAPESPGTTPAIAVDAPAGVVAVAATAAQVPPGELVYNLRRVGELLREAVAVVDVGGGGRGAVGMGAA
ncbi:hypothetical protein MMPV_006540 [Pyropia vietnamensis]